MAARNNLNSSGNHAPQSDIQGFLNLCCAFVPCEVVQFVSCTKPYVCSTFSSSPSLPHW